MWKFFIAEIRIQNLVHTLINWKLPWVIEPPPLIVYLPKLACERNHQKRKRVGYFDMNLSSEQSKELHQD
jgi:hypothetical protein